MRNRCMEEVMAGVRDLWRLGTVRQVLAVYIIIIMVIIIKLKLNLWLTAPKEATPVNSTSGTDWQITE